MNDINEFVKRYDTKDDFISALYQLWTMPGMVNRASIIGGLCFDGESGVYQEAFIYDGIEEAAFCAFFHTAPLKEIRLAQGYKSSHGKLHITGFLQQNSIYVGSADENDWPLLLEVQEKMDRFHSAPVFPKQCTWTGNFSHTIDGRTPKMTITDIIQRLKDMPVMKPKIMVVDEGTIRYHPLDEKCKAADWLYAYDEGTKQLMIYNTLDDVLVTANL